MLSTDPGRRGRAGPCRHARAGPCRHAPAGPCRRAPVGPCPRAGPCRRALLALALALALALPGAVPAVAATGGPDAFGYTWRDGDEPGVAYDWQDPGPTAVDVTVLGDDTTTGFLPISFGFPYHGATYAQLAICSNGWISFVDDTSTTFTNVRIPTVGEPQGVVAAWWNDLELTNRTSRVTLEDLGTRAIVTWEGAHDRGDTRARNDFQVILHDDGRLVVQLDRLSGDTTSASLGIESPSQLIGLEVFRNPPGGVTAPHVVEIIPPVIVPNDLDCGAAQPLACNASLAGDLATGAANQERYGCPAGLLDGREQVFTLDLPAPRDVRFVVDAGAGQAQVVVLDGCDPNRCLGSGPVVELDDVVGSLVVVVDVAAGGEGPYQLFTDCFPVPTRLACAGATPLACGDVVSSDLARGRADQARYWCTPDDLGGREEVYRLDLATPTTLRVDLTPLGGAPRLLLLRPCDASFCTVPIGDVLHLEDATGAWFVVVDSAPGEEGPYQLSVTCLGDGFGFCGDGVFEAQAGLDDNGSWAVPGLLYDAADTHSWALRVDGGAVTYSQDETCTPFPFTSAGAVEPGGPGVVTWEAPEARLDVTVAPTDAAGCCGLVVTAVVTNSDSVPHRYDLRVVHDLAFGLGDGTCTTDVVNGGPVDVGGTRLTREAELLPLRADTCAGQVLLYSAEDPATLRGSVEMLPPAAPSDMELLSWESAAFPCDGWSDLGTGQDVASCLGDSALLLTWRLPPVAGTLAPGESASARWRLGWGCEFSCIGPCEDPVQPGPATVVDEDACERGLRITWPPATFPGGGSGVYHVFRSTASHADALARPPVTPPGGLAATSWLDPAAPIGVDVFHVVMAESLDFPGCGDGPLVEGSTATLAAGPSQDVAAADPVLATATGTDVDGCGPDVRLEWAAAAFPGTAGGAYHVYRSTAGFADALARPPITPVGGVAALTWLDAAPPANLPLYYVVQAEAFDRPGCGDGPAVDGRTDAFQVGPLTDLVASDPALGGGSVSDPDACTRGLELTWDPAVFPAATAGRYHVHRSAVSAADALLRPPITPAGGITTTAWTDATVPLATPHWYAVVAEAIEYPGCGDGPAVGGPTDSLTLGQATDVGTEDPVLPAAAGADEDGCAPGVRLDWEAVAFPGTAGGAYHVYRSTASFADARARPPLTPAGGTAALAWSDPAPPPNVPLYYVVLAEGFESPGCGDGPAVGGRTDAVDVGPLTDAVSGDVVVAGAAAGDESPCTAGILVAWDAAAFPGPGRGRYHVHRSEISVADALARPPLTPVAGIATTAWLDAGAPLGVPQLYAVIAESTDFPGCGDGPSVGGPSAVMEAGSATDLEDTVPPSTVVGQALRLSDGTPGSVALAWPAAATPPAGEEWVVLRSDGAPGGPFAAAASGVGPAWTDGDAARTGPRPHCWFYDVRVEDSCLNVSPD